MYVGDVARNHGFVYVPEMKACTYEKYGETIGPQHCIPGTADMIRAGVKAETPPALCSGAELPKVLHNFRALEQTTDDFNVILSPSLSSSS